MEEMLDGKPWMGVSTGHLISAADTHGLKTTFKQTHTDHTLTLAVADSMTGSSGSPVFDDQWRLLAVLTAGETYANYITCILKLPLIQTLLSRGE